MEIIQWRQPNGCSHSTGANPRLKQRQKNNIGMMFEPAKRFDNIPMLFFEWCFNRRFALVKKTKLDQRKAIGKSEFYEVNLQYSVWQMLRNNQSF